MKSFLIAFIGELALFAQLSLFAQYRVTVPYVKENGKITINAEVNGYQGRFLVDTGAPCSLTYSFMQRAGIVPFDSVQVQDSNGHLLTTRVAELESLKLDGFTFSCLQVICLEKDNIVENFKIDGIIGYNLMKMGIVKLDGSNHTFTLTSSEKGLGIDSLCGIPLVKDPYLVRIPVRFADNEQDTVMFDSGASPFYAMSATSHRRLSEKHSKSFEQLGKRCGNTVVGSIRSREGFHEISPEDTSLLNRKSFFSKCHYHYHSCDGFPNRFRIVKSWQHRYQLPQRGILLHTVGFG